MDVRIEHLTSNIRATGSQALLDPQVLEQVAQIVLERVRRERAAERRADAETGYVSTSVAREGME